MAHPDIGFSHIMVNPDIGFNHSMADADIGIDHFVAETDAGIRRSAMFAITACVVAPRIVTMGSGRVRIFVKVTKNLCRFTKLRTKAGGICTRGRSICTKGYKS